MKTLKEFDSARTEAWKKHSEKFDCDCRESELRERTLANGSLQLVRQCLRCGRAVGNPVKRASVSEVVAPFDQELQDRYEADRDADAKSISKSFSRDSFFEAYDPYLASPAWAQKRALVFKRANGICEGCGLAVPSEVHHLTYEHVGNEFLFELVALCGACHDRIHPE